MLEAESGLILWEILKFAILLLVLRVYAWKPLMRALRTRETTIQHAMESAEQAKREAEKILKNSRDAFRKSNQEFETTQERSKPVLDKIREEAIASAEKQTDAILNASREQIQGLRRKAIQQLQAEIGGMVVDCAAAIVDNVVDSGLQRKLTSKALDSIPAASIIEDQDTP